MPSPTFHIVCQSCDIETTADELAEVETFARKHKKHTGHNLNWEEADFSTPFAVDKEWRLACSTCGDSWEFSLRTKAMDFKQEHAEYTNHEIEQEPEAVEADPNPERMIHITADFELEDLHEYIYLVDQQFGGNDTDDRTPLELIYEKFTSVDGVTPEAVRQKVVELDNEMTIRTGEGDIGLITTPDRFSPFGVSE